MTDVALRVHAPKAERWEMGTDVTAYWQLVTQLWADQESFLLIEHDIEITAQAIRQARHCDCWWSVTPYTGPGIGPAEPRTLLGALGCTRFRAPLLKAFPTLMGVVGDVDDATGGIIKRDYRRLDTRMLGALRDRGYEPHLHWPTVKHHRLYSGVCACGDEHDPFPADVDGRYHP